MPKEVTVEYSVTRLVTEVMDSVQGNSTSSTGSSKLAIASSTDDSTKDEESKDDDEPPRTKSVHLSTEVKNGRTYMTKK